MTLEFGAINGSGVATEDTVNAGVVTCDKDSIRSRIYGEDLTSKNVRPHAQLIFARAFTRVHRSMKRLDLRVDLIKNQDKSPRIGGTRRNSSPKR